MSEQTNPEPSAWKLILFAFFFVGSIASFCGMAVFDGEIRVFCTTCCLWFTFITAMIVIFLCPPKEEP